MDIVFFLTCAKLAVGVVGVGRGLFELEESPRVVLQVLVVLRVDGVHLPLCSTGREQRAQEELGEPTNQVTYR